MKDKSISLNASNLKWIAIILMPINHLCAPLSYYTNTDSYFINEAHWYLTRVVFIIFAFLLAEGMHYTRSRKKYILSLFIFALISEIPYNLWYRMHVFDFSEQNVMWTLAISATAISLIDKYEKKPGISLLITLIAMCINTVLNGDYSFLGVAVVISFYYFRENRTKQLIITAIVYMVCNLTLRLHGYVGSGLSLSETLVSAKLWKGYFKGSHALLAWPILMLYNGQKGKNINKWFFYIFYPAHLFLVYLILKFWCKV